MTTHIYHAWKPGIAPVEVATVGDRDDARSLAADMLGWRIEDVLVRYDRTETDPPGVYVERQIERAADVIRRIG